MREGDARPDSDVEVLVEFIDTPGFFDFVGTKTDIEEKIKISVDLVTFRAAGKKKHMMHILDEAKDV